MTFLQHQSKLYNCFELVLNGFLFGCNSADARLRIVSERVDIIDNLIISVSVTPNHYHILLHDAQFSTLFMLSLYCR